MFNRFLETPLHQHPRVTISTYFVRRYTKLLEWILYEIFIAFSCIIDQHNLFDNSSKTSTTINMGDEVLTNFDEIYRLLKLIFLPDRICI